MASYLQLQPGSSSSLLATDSTVSSHSNSTICYSSTDLRSLLSTATKLQLRQLITTDILDKLCQVGILKRTRRGCRARTTRKHHRPSCQSKAIQQHVQMPLGPAEPSHPQPADAPTCGNLISELQLSTGTEAADSHTASPSPAHQPDSQQPCTTLDTSHTATSKEARAENPSSAVRSERRRMAAK